MTPDQPKIEVFKESELRIDMMKHMCVPKYRLLSSKQTGDYLKSAHAKKADLWKMSVSDQAARYMGLAIGQVVQFERANPCSGLEEIHRVIVPDT